MRRIKSSLLSPALLGGLMSMLALALTLAWVPASAQEAAQRKPPTAAIPADTALRTQLLATRQALESERARALNEAQQRQNLQKLLAELRAELRAKIAAQDRRIADLEQRNRDLDDSLTRERSSHEKALDEARQDVAAARGEIRQLQGELSKSREVLAALTTDRDSWRRRAHEAEQRLDRLGTALDEKDAAIAQLIHDRWLWVAGAATLALAVGVAGTRWLVAKPMPQPVSFSVSPGPWSVSCTGLGPEGATPVRLQASWLPLRAEVRAAGPLIEPPAS